jgi:thiamine-monophosphate kinase
VDEFELIRRYFQRQTLAPEVLTGIGDDGAVVRPPKGKELVTVIDTLVAGTHFPDSLDAADIGYRVVAVNLSDIAAMGAQPRWMTMALTLVETDADWLERFATGLYEAAAEWNVQLVGGDTTQGSGLVVSIQMTGDVDPGQAIHRSGAKVGDAIYVTGTLGDAAAWLGQDAAVSENDYLAARFARPTARVGTGLALAGVANAAIDISDGLVADLSKVLEASEVGAELHIDRLPLSAELIATAGPKSARRFAMGGGDDYELCFTLPESQLPPDLPSAITEIGRVSDSGQLVCLDQGVVVPFDHSGYRHFQ